MMELISICRAVKKYLKNNKVTIAAELLKNGGPQLVDALEEVIQLAWTWETLPESWTKEVLFPVYKKTRLHQLSRYLPVERCIQSLRQSIIRPIVTLRQWSFSITKLGSSQANQRQTNSLHCAKPLKKVSFKLTISL
jgi:hypothetical protein